MHNKPANIPKDAKFLQGVGASAYFHIQKNKDNNSFRIKRFSENGKLDCDNIFKLQKEGFDISKKYEITFVSHCLKCTVIQNNKKFIFEIIS